MSNVDDVMRRMDVRGWGPDFTEVDVVCQEPDCPWERSFAENGSASLGEILDAVQQHVKEMHGG